MTMFLSGVGRTFYTAALVFTAVSVICLGGLPPAAANERPRVSVDSATGETGQTVGVSVTIRGSEDLAETGGISGGQLELVYDPALAAVEDVIRGSAVGAGFIFLYNRGFAPNKVRLAWAAQGEEIIRDGALFTVIFRLKTAAAVRPYLRNLVLYDQDLRSLEVAAAGEDHTVYLIAPGAEAPPSPEDPPVGNGEEGGAPAEEDPPRKGPPAGDQNSFFARVFSSPVLPLVPAGLLVGVPALLFLLRRRKKKAARRSRGKPLERKKNRRLLCTPSPGIRILFAVACFTQTGDEGEINHGQK